MGKITTIFPFFCILCAGVLDTCLGVEKNEAGFHDFNLTSIEIIWNYGYPAEVHKVQTEDGYILELHRIPHGKFSDSKRGVPILLGHGLLATSVEFLLLESDSLAFVLADAGYDVWMLNFRGSTYSRNHISLDANDTKFWNFSWHENGFYDIPSSIDYICKYTQRDQLLFIGHSMGTTAFLVTVSTRPEYQKKLQGAILLGPTAYLKHTKTPLRILAPFSKTIRGLYEVIGKGGLFKQTPELQNFMKVLCRPQFFCKNFLFLVAGRNSRGFQNKILPKAVMHLPASTSVKTVAHFGQLITSGKFQQYDYGTAGNMKRYNQPKPPIYNLEAITLPLSIYIAPNDFFTTGKDLQRLLFRLRSVKNVYVIPSPKFTHVDFIVSKNVGEIFYPELLKDLEQLTSHGTVAKHAHGRHEAHPNKAVPNMNYNQDHHNTIQNTPVDHGKISRNQADQIRVNHNEVGQNKAVPNMNHNQDHRNTIQNTPVDHGKISYNQPDQIRVNHNEVDQNKVVYNKPQYNTPDQTKYVYNIDNTNYNQADYKQIEIVYDETEQNNEVYSKTDYNVIDQNKVVANEANQDNIVYKDGQYNQVIQNEGVYNKDQFNQAIQNEGVYSEGQYNQAIDQNKIVYNADYNPVNQNEIVYSETQQNKNVYSEADYNSINQNKVIYNEANQDNIVYTDSQYNQAIQNEGVYNEDRYYQPIDQNKIVYNPPAYNFANHEEIIYTEVDENDPFYEIDYIPIEYKKVKYLPLNYKNVDYSGAQYSDF